MAEFGMCSDTPGPQQGSGCCGQAVCPTLHWLWAEMQLQTQMGEMITGRGRKEEGWRTEPFKMLMTSDWLYALIFLFIRASGQSEAFSTSIYGDAGNLMSLCPAEQMSDSSFWWPYVWGVLLYPLANPSKRSHWALCTAPGHWICLLVGMGLF